MDKHIKNTTIQAIKDLKSKLGSHVFIAAHHYQSSDIVSLADFVGDSYKLSVEAAKSTAQDIVFCGVSFMADSALLLARKDQRIWMPNPKAGCPMADMIDADSFQIVLDALNKSLNENVIPLTYMNSNVEVKALTGIHDGAIVTSSNALHIVEHYLKKGMRILFSPDKNLGTNVAHKMGLTETEILVLPKATNNNPLVTYNSLSSLPNLKEVRMFLWDGFCPIHRLFSPLDVKRIRVKYPQARIYVHPESDPNVVLASDGAGSTEYLSAILKESPDSADIFAIGTEASFVYRFAKDLQNKKIIPLKESFCKDMTKTNAQNLLSCLQTIEKAFYSPTATVSKTTAKIFKNQIHLDPKLISPARKALQRMIEITEDQ